MTNKELFTGSPSLCWRGIVVAALSVFLVKPVAAEPTGRPMLVEQGRANAQIVIAEAPPRTVSLAAKELQSYLRKISGAELPIVTEPAPDLLLKIYVGRSKFTDALSITAAGLTGGGYRMVSGPDWLALLGEDSDYVPIEPYSHDRKDIDRATADWDKITGAKWMNPMWTLYRRYNAKTGLWQQDDGGSFNAVCGFLRELGVRWYMPGDLGEVVPKLSSVALPAVDRSVQPHYLVRHWHGAYDSFTADTVLWDRRIGINCGYRQLGSSAHVHGLKRVYIRPEMQEKHPEFMAIVGGRRDTHHANLLSEALVQETARFARTSFDHYNEPAVSIWPGDGLRQSEDAAAMTQADYVAQFVNRVALTTLKTHPDRLITFGAYAGYRQPPENIEQFPPNVMVFLAAHRPGLDDPQLWEQRMQLVNGWKKKTPNQPMVRNANSYYEFVIHPRSFARELKALKGISIGDWNEVRRRSGGKEGVIWNTPGIDHLNAYVNASFLWDADQDIEKVLDEYHTLFYGPARDKTKEAFDFAEANYTRGVDGARFPTEHRIAFVEKMLEAKKQVEGTVYGERIATVLADIKPLEELRADLKEEIAARERPNAPLALVASGKDAEPKTYPLVEMRGGAEPDVQTRFQVRWDDNHLVFDITCQEPDMANAFVTQDVWGGDSVSILIESQPGTGDYYQFEINQDGGIVDASRRENKGTINERWDSLAVAKAEKHADFWRLSVRFPIIGMEAGALDPLHNIVGEKPTKDRPWFFQVGRARFRDGKRSAYSFSPVGEGKKGYHNLVRFGRLEVE